MSEQNYPSYLIHYGIEGQKWGVRRFQNEDGTYTSEGLERRRQLFNEGHPIKALKAGIRGRREAKYNKQLAKQQNTYNKKFDKVTSRIEKDRSHGLNPSSRDVKKAINYGTQVRGIDYVAKDPKMHYKLMRGAELSGFFGGIVGGTVVTAINAARYNKYYKKAFESAKNETIADLKKRKLI